MSFLSYLKWREQKRFWKLHLFYNHFCVLKMLLVCVIKTKHFVLLSQGQNSPVLVWKSTFQTITAYLWGWLSINKSLPFFEKMLIYYSSFSGIKNYQLWSSDFLQLQRRNVSLILLKLMWSVQLSLIFIVKPFNSPEISEEQYHNQQTLKNLNKPLICYYNCQKFWD